MALIVLDASVVIAHLGAGDTLHALATSYMREHIHDDLRLPASAYAEVLVDPARSGRVADIRQAINDEGVTIEPITSEVAERAASLRAASRGLRLADAFVLGTAEALGADEVATGDRRWRRFDRVRVIG